ncbi:hypothetical protein TeGR_g2757 [Tetraparma gracilis]|uniref:Uncharacterized protein n=1 Tax=Tetraparma gracilis TaxID=2962635 RepID=A0ABQ6M3R6_9STRA|nr:hypothetical protein TeGR_g2757 [Tetraparma gracilis]
MDTPKVAARTPSPENTENASSYMSFDFSPSKFRSSSSVRDSTDSFAEAYTNSYSKMMARFPKKKKKSVETEVPPVKTYDPLTKTYSYVTTTYGNVKSTTAEQYPRTNRAIEGAESAVVKTLVWAFAKLKEEHQESIKKIDVQAELRKADDRINPAVIRWLEEGQKGVESARKSAEVVLVVKPYVDSVARFLPVETAQKLTMWVLRQSLAQKDVLLQLVGVVGRKREEAAEEEKGKL